MANPVMQRSATGEEPAQSLVTVPPQEEIASLAYALWLQRGSPEGSLDEDWLKAEQELKESSVALA